MEPGARYHPCIGDVIPIKLVGKLWLHTGCDKVLPLISSSPPELAIDVVVCDRDLGNHALLEKGLETAVGNRLDLAVFLVLALNEQNSDQCNDHVPEINLSLLVY